MVTCHYTIILEQQPDGGFHTYCPALQSGFIFERQKGSHAVYLRAADHRRLVIPMHKGRDLKRARFGA